MTKIKNRAAVRAALGLALLFVIRSDGAAPDGSERITPVLLSVQEAPIPFLGSDGRLHLVYELWLDNFTSSNLAVEHVEVLAGATVLQTLGGAAIASRLQPAGRREPSATMAGSTQALLFLHVTLPAGQAAPKQLLHRVRVHADAAPPGQQNMTLTGGETTVDGRPVAVLGPPLRGEGYISADSCCDSTRHVRAALPVNGRVWLAQRFAVDWEQLDKEGRIYHGPQGDVRSYAIYGKEVLAVADGRVASVVDNLPNQVPGAYPANIPIEQADGNSVVLDLGGGNFALYAHLQPGSLVVGKGDSVKRGQVIGRVGNTGNSVAPHLHFHVMSTASPLASSGLPYEIASFEVTATTPGTAAFDSAEEHGTPLAVRPLSPPERVRNGLPLDQQIISF